MNRRSLWGPFGSLTSPPSRRTGLSWVILMFSSVSDSMVCWTILRKVLQWILGHIGASLGGGDLCALASLPRSLPTPLTWCQPFHFCTWPHLMTHPRPENISSLPAPPPSSSSSSSSSSSLPFFGRSSLHFENFLPQTTVSKASCLSDCFPWYHHLLVLTMLTEPGSIHSVFDSDFPDLDLNLTTTVGCLSGFGIAHQFTLPLVTSAPRLICLLGVFVADSINHCRVLSYISALHFHHAAWSFWSKSVPCWNPILPRGDPLLLKFNLFHLPSDRTDVSHTYMIPLSVPLGRAPALQW